MRQFIQHRFSRSMLKAAVGYLLLIAGLQQGYGQCVQCDNTTTTGIYSSAIGGSTTATGYYSFAGGLLSSATGDLSLAFGNRVEVAGTSSF